MGGYRAPVRPSPPETLPNELHRVVGTGGAILLGLGSILGTGVFVSLGLAAEVAGAALLVAVLLAAGVASCNGLSSAQLAAAFPLSGGTYEYGHRTLTPGLGFVAGWTFLSAKSASAAAAALALAAHAVEATGQLGPTATPWLAAGLVGAVTWLVAAGLRRSNRANLLLVGTTCLGLGAFVVVGWPRAIAGAETAFAHVLGAGGASPRELLHATALLFVAFTGYGRVATLGEEIRDPARSIPRAVLLTLAVAAAIYLAVAFVAVGAAGADELARSTAATGAPLESLGREFAPSVGVLILIAAATALCGVLLNLVLGLSRVLLAMARRGDAPRALAHVQATSGSPARAVWVTGGVVSALALGFELKTAWSFSAFTVLVYYALTNLAALRLPGEQRRYPRVFAVAGLASCASLAFFVEARTWLVGCAWIAFGLVVRAIARGLRGNKESVA